jgi:hypothetical protein
MGGDPSAHLNSARQTHWRRKTMLGFLAKAVIAAGVGAVAVAAWKKYDLGTKVTGLADQALTAILVGGRSEATAEFSEKATGQAHVPGADERLVTDDLVEGYGR